MPDTGVLDQPPTPQLDEALPARYVDAVHDGVKGGNRAQFGMLVSICMAARNRGWTYARTADYVCDPLKSGLWRQLCQDHKGKPHSAATTLKTFDNGWTAAGDHLNSNPYNSEDMRQKVVEEAFAVVDMLEDPDLDVELTEPQRATLCYVAGEIIKRGWATVTCPTRDIVAATGVPRQKIRTALLKLVELRWLLKISSGQPGAKHAKAAIYALGPKAK